MCTIGAATTKNGAFLFKNMDPRRGFPFKGGIEYFQKNNTNIIVVKDENGCYGGINEKGVAVVGTFVNIQEFQNNYFANENLLDILAIGEFPAVLNHLKNNRDNLFGNLLLADKLNIEAIELAGNLIYSKTVKRYVMTNHFQELSLQLRTIKDDFIKEWTTSRLRRAQILIENVRSIDNAKEFLSDHVGAPDFSICNHGLIATAASYIFDCNNKCVLFCNGNSCSNCFTKYSFEN